MNLPGRRPQGALLARAEPIPIEAPQTKARKQSQRRMERRGAIRESSFRLSVLLAPCVRHRRRPAPEMIPCPRLGNGRSDRRFVIPELALHGVIFSRRASRASSCHRLSSLCPRCLSDRARSAWVGERSFEAETQRIFTPLVSGKLRSSTQTIHYVSVHRLAIPYSLEGWASRAGGCPVRGYSLPRLS
jgi:hypothetical protein